jgi:hypothetical protein
MRDDSQINKLTKKYIIDFLNAMFFSNTVSWDSDDQFNQLPILEEETDTGRHFEQRGVLLIHKKYPWAIKILITVLEDTKQQICYRIVGIKDKVSIEDPKKICIPFDGLHIDFSISDLNLGVQESTSYSFCDNLGNLTTRVFALLRFLLDATFVAFDQRDLFEDLLVENISQPPLGGDIHYAPIYGVSSE